MIERVLLGVTLLTSVASAATSEKTAIAAKNSREVLRRCGPGETQFASAPDADWTPVPSAAAKHATLRQALDEPMPSGRSMVSIHGVGGDLATTEYSVVIARGEDGVWKGTAVGQSKIWIEGAKPTIMRRQAWTLPLDKGHRLDALLADRCFYAEPTSFHYNQVPAVGVLFIDLESQTPDRQRRVSYKGGNVEGITKEVTELTFPPAS